MKETDLREGEVEQLATGFGFVEGPVWHPDGYWLFSDIPSNRIHRITPDGVVEVYRAPSGNSNGLTLNREGRLLACEHGNRRVSIANIGGGEETFVDTFEGKKLNSPNDVVVHSSGAVYLTDPPYGIKPEQMEQPCAGVYRVDPDGATQRVIADFEKPNGLAFSPDESVLYIADTQSGRRFSWLDQCPRSSGQLRLGGGWPDLVYDGADIGLPCADTDCRHYRADSTTIGRGAIHGSDSVAKRTTSVLR